MLRNGKFVLFSLIALLFICTLQLYITIGDFANSDKWTNTIESVATDAIEFPIITLCNFNRVNKSKLPDIGLDDGNLRRYVKKLGLEDLARELAATVGELSLIDHFLAVLFESFWNSYVLPPKMMGAQHQSMRNMTLGRALYNEFLKHNPKFSNQMDILTTLALDCSATYMCSFGGRPFDCCNNSRRVFTEYGSCFTVQIPEIPWMKTPVQRIPGARSGLAIYVCTQSYNHISTLVNNWLQIGFQLFAGYDPSHISTSHVALPIGFHSTIEMKKFVYTIAHNKGLVLYERPCTTKQYTDMLSRIGIQQVNYSLMACVSECFAVEVYHNCKCVPIEISRHVDFSYRSCSPDDLYDCVMPKMTTVWNQETPGHVPKKLFDYYQQCHKECRRPCDRSYIHLTSSVSTAPSPVLAPAFVSYLNKTHTELTETQLNQGFVAFDVFFAEISFTLIETYPKATLEQLVGNVGGLISLYIGVSAFTLVQFIESCFNRFRGQQHPSATSSTTSLYSTVRSRLPLSARQ